MAFGENLLWVSEVVAEHGEIVSYSSMADPTPRLPFYPLMRRNVTIRPVFVYTVPEPAKRAAVAAVCRHLDAGELRHRVGFESGLDAIVDAYRALQDGSVRCSVLVTTVGATRGRTC